MVRKSLRCKGRWFSPCFTFSCLINACFRRGRTQTQEMRKRKQHRFAKDLLTSSCFILQNIFRLNSCKWLEQKEISDILELFLTKGYSSSSSKAKAWDVQRTNYSNFLTLPSAANKSNKQLKNQTNKCKKLPFPVVHLHQSRSHGQPFLLWVSREWALWARSTSSSTSSSSSSSPTSSSSSSSSSSTLSSTSSSTS